MKTATEIIQDRITELKKEINGLEDSEQSFLQAKYIKSLYLIVKELETIISKIENQ